eukprot:6514-Amphidinium_carterae.1
MKPSRLAMSLTQQCMHRTCEDRTLQCPVGWSLVSWHGHWLECQPVYKPLGAMPATALHMEVHERTHDHMCCMSHAE